MLLGSETRVFIDELGFLEIIYGCDFPPALIYLYYHMSEKVDWDAFGMEATFVGYDFSTGSVDGVSAAVSSGHFLYLNGRGNSFSRSGFPMAIYKCFTTEMTKNSAFVVLFGGEPLEHVPKSYGLVVST